MLKSSRNGFRPQNSTLGLGDKPGGIYTVATLPSASIRSGQTIWVTDGNDGAPCAAISDGTNWLRLIQGIPVSAIDIPTTGLLLYYRGDTPGFGSSWTDLAGSHPGTLVNGATWGGGGVQMDAVNDYVNIADGWTDLIAGLTTWTIEMKVHLDSVGQVFWSRGNGYEHYGACYPDGRLQFRYETGGDIQGTAGDIVSGAELSIVWTYDEATTTGKGYVNGVEKLSGTVDSVNSDSDDLYVGEYALADGTYALDGTVFRFAIWNRVLSGGEISGLAP